VKRFISLAKSVVLEYFMILEYPYSSCPCFIPVDIILLVGVECGVSDYLLNNS
jgi:hypothetical protein